MQKKENAVLNKGVDKFNVPCYIEPLTCGHNSVGRVQASQA